MILNKYFCRIPGVIFFILSGLMNYSCKKDNAALPAVTTSEVTDINQTTAISGGIVSNDGGSSIISKGVCWNCSDNPTIEEGKTNDGWGSGSFKSNIIHLIPNTLYYLRAYAINSAGTAYGNRESFTTLSDTTVTDVDGNIYNIVTIGTQTWMKQNLKTTRFRNYTDIPLVTSDLDWFFLTTPGYCWYENAANYKSTYGALYNWYAVDAGRNRDHNICPVGWHVPSDNEWTTLITYLGGDSVAVGKLRESGFSHWQNPNSDASNTTGFTALPGGGRDFNGSFCDNGSYGYWWSATEFITGGAWSRYMSFDGSGGFRHGNYETDGFSVRCIRDN
jgi:uncharacterized protein (TIGR02145 family)